MIGAPSSVRLFALSLMRRQSNHMQQKQHKKRAHHDFVICKFEFGGRIDFTYLDLT